MFVGAVPYITVDLSIVYTELAVPTITAIGMNNSAPVDSPTRNDWTPAVQDPSTAKYFDFVCDYESVSLLLNDVEWVTILGILDCALFHA